MTIIKTVVKQFRRPLFEQLSEVLSADGVELRVLYGSPSHTEKAKQDSIELEPPIGRRIPSVYLSRRALLQWPGIRDISDSDLLIVVNANRNLLNIPLLALSTLGLKKVALWGHGYNHQSSRASLPEQLKRRLVALPDWWFAYTEDTAQYLRSVGFPENRITTIENAVDTTRFAAAVRSVSVDEISAMRDRLCLGQGARIGLYCGSLYPEKRLTFLIDASSRIARAMPEFKLIVIGAGEEERLVRDAAERFQHVRYAGPMFGRDKAVCFRMADVMLNPGLVGLGVLDAFAAGVPFLTMSNSRHSPEIAYLEDGVNGFKISGTEADFAHAALSVLADLRVRATLRAGAQFASQRYTIANMVSRVRDGILRCAGSTRVGSIRQTP